MTPDKWDSVLAVNIAAQLRINEALLTSGDFTDAPRIVALASTSGIAGNRGQTNYAASKAGVIGMVRATAPLLAAFGGTANAVAPGFIETDMTARIPPSRGRSPAGSTRCSRAASRSTSPRRSRSSRRRSRRRRRAGAAGVRAEHGGPVTTTVVLPRGPGARRALRRAARRAARCARRVRPGPSSLPDVAYVVHGVRADAEHLTAVPAPARRVRVGRAARRVRARAGVPRRDRAHGPARLPAAARRAGAPGQPGDAAAAAAARRRPRRPRVGARPARAPVRARRWTSSPRCRVDGDGRVARGVHLPRAGAAPGRGRARRRRRHAFVPPTPTARWTLAGDAGAGTPPSPATATRSTCPRCPPRRSASRGPSRTACTRRRARSPTSAPARGDAFDWSVEFAKPVLLPGTVTVRVARAAEGLRVRRLARPLRQAAPDRVGRPRCAEPGASGRLGPRASRREGSRSTRCRRGSRRVPAGGCAGHPPAPRRAGMAAIERLLRRRHGTPRARSPTSRTRA